MSLMDNFGNIGIMRGMLETCTMIDKTTRPDGQFGFKPTWVDGAQFQAMIEKNNSTEAQIAERQGVKELYTVVVQRGAPLKYQDVFRRESDGAVFRVTSNTTDAPNASTVKIARVSAERWEIPDDD